MSIVKVNQVQRYNCDACCDQGGYEICHPSTDARIGWRDCDVCPPMPPVWKTVAPFWRGEWKKTPAELATEAAWPF